MAVDVDVSLPEKICIMVEIQNLQLITFCSKNLYPPSNFNGINIKIFDGVVSGAAW